MEVESIAIDDLRNLLPPPSDIDWGQLSKSDDEEDYSRAAFELLQECGGVVAAIAGIQIKGELDRNHAICSGLAIRLMKLAKVIVRDLSNRDTFQQLSISRQIFETAGTLVYLLNDDGDGSRFDQYVQGSLVAEKVMLADIENNIKKRGGEVLDIELRLQASIEKTSKAGGVDDIRLLPARKTIGFPNAEGLMKNLGENVYFAYRASSSEVHGSWTDLYKYHLVEVGDGKFVPNPQDTRVQPNVATTTTSVLARVFGAYLNWLDVNMVTDLYDPVLTKIIENNDRLIASHEEYISRAS
jgi:hypothetical protein